MHPAIDWGWNMPAPGRCIRVIREPSPRPIRLTKVSASPETFEFTRAEVEVKVFDILPGQRTCPEGWEAQWAKGWRPPRPPYRRVAVDVDGNRVCTQRLQRLDGESALDAYLMVLHAVVHEFVFGVVK